MKISLFIKIIGILSFIASIIAIIIIGLLFYNVAQIGIELGNVKIESSLQKLELTVPLFISNKGQFPITGLFLSSKVQDEYNELIAEGTTGPIDIQPGTIRKEILHKLVIDLTKVKREVLERLIFKDQKLQIGIQTSLSMPPFFKISILPKIPFKWGAPISNLQYGFPKFTPYNKTHILFLIPISFNNNSPYMNVESLIRVSIFNEKGQRQGFGEIFILARPKSSFKDDMKLYLSFTDIDPQKLLFNGVQLNYRVLMEGYVSGFKAFTEERPISFNWGALLAEFKIGTPQFLPYNSTTFKMDIPISFINQNQFIGINTPILITILNTAGQKVGSGFINIIAQPGSPFSGTMTSFILTKAINLESLIFNDTKLEYDILLEGKLDATSISIKRRVSFEWGAPMKNMSFGKVQFQIKNATHSTFKIPISFINNSPIELDISIKGGVRDAKGIQVGYIDPQSLKVLAKREFFGELKGSLINEAIMGKRFTLSLIFKTQFGEFIKEVSISA